MTPESEVLATRRAPEEHDRPPRPTEPSLAADAPWFARWLTTSVVWAVAAFVVLQASTRLQRHTDLWPGSALMDLLVVWLVVVGVAGLLGSMRWGGFSTLVLAVALGAVNAVRLEMLHTPVVPADLVYLARPGFLVSMVGVGGAVSALLGGVLGTALLAWGLSRVRWARVPRPASRTGLRRWYTVRAVAVVLALVTVVTGARFNENGNPLRAGYEGMGARWFHWNQASNYRVNGFIGGLLYNGPADVMEKPAGYTKEALEAVARRWGSSGGGADRGSAPNVVVVLSESFADPGRLPSVRLEEDAIPNFHALEQEFASGVTPGVYGTGTSAMEFQVLTGQSMGLFNPQVASPYQQFVTKREAFPSSVGWAKSRGYRTVALHPFDPSFYRRDEVYPLFGFDEFLGEDDLPRSRGGAFVEDEIPFDAVVGEIAKSDAPVFAHVVTMQNHVPVAAREDAVGVSGISGSKASEIGSWARGLQESDAALGKLVRDLTEVDEPTILLYFGDHFPGILPEDLVEEQATWVNRTPFVVWNNVRSTGRSAGGDDQGVLGANALLATALEEAGVDLPGMFRLAVTVQREVGVVRGDDVVRNDGTVVRIDDLTQDERDLLHDFRLVQYDVVEGHGWAAEALWR